MATNVDMGGDTLYVQDIFYGDTTPGSLSGTSLSSQFSGGGTVSMTAATYAPTAAQSGEILIFNKSGGVTVTLPAPVIGLTYTFAIGTTSTANKIITSAGTIFLQGGLYFDKALTITRYDGNGSTHVSLNFNGTTTGGIAGDIFHMTCLSATEWTVEGTVAASGTLATPFGTS